MMYKGGVVCGVCLFLFSSSFSLDRYFRKGKCCVGGWHVWLSWATCGSVVLVELSEV